MHTYSYIYTVTCTLNSRLISGHLGVVAGALREFIFPVRYGSVGVQLPQIHALCQGTLTAQCVVLQNTMQQSSRFFFYSRVYRVISSELVEQEQKMRTVTNKKHPSRRANHLRILLQPQHDSRGNQILKFSRFLPTAEARTRTRHPAKQRGQGSDLGVWHLLRPSAEHRLHCYVDPNSDCYSCYEPSRGGCAYLPHVGDFFEPLPKPNSKTLDFFFFFLFRLTNRHFRYGEPDQYR